MAKDPLAELLASLFGTFGTPGRRADEFGSKAGGEGDGTIPSKTERLRQKAAERRVAQLRRQIEFRLERDTLNFAVVAERIGTAGQGDLDRAWDSLDRWARPVRRTRPRPDPEAPIDAFSLARVRSAIATTMSSVKQSLADQARRLVRDGEEQILAERTWYRREVASMALELGRMKAGHHVPPEREWWDIEQALKSKGEAELKRWRARIAEAEQARLRAFETAEAGLLARTSAEYDLAAWADPAKVVSLDMVRARHGRRGIALFRPFPPPASGFRHRSRFGGLPDLPGGVDWPRNERGGALRFLAQIDLAEMHHDIAELPRSGTLLFFAGSGLTAAKMQGVVIFDADSTGSQAAAPGEPPREESILPYWPLAGGLVETIPAPESLDAETCFKPEYAGYCRAYEEFGRTQFAFAAAPMKAGVGQRRHESRNWPEKIFAAHVTGYPWTWRGLGYVAQGLARSFAHLPDVGGGAAGWLTEAGRHEPDAPLPPPVAERFTETVNAAREYEAEINRRNENVRPNGLGAANANALERLLLGAAADRAVAASLPAELTATLADTHTAVPAGQMLGHLQGDDRALDQGGDEVCLLQIFSEPPFSLGAPELRFLILREALLRRAWNEVRLWSPSRPMTERVEGGRSGG